MASQAAWSPASDTLGPAAAGAPQLQLLDLFVPGFSTAAAAVQRQLGVDLNLYIPLLLMAALVVLGWSQARAWVWESVEEHFMSAVDIRIDDEIYNIVMSWVAAQGFATNSRRFIANTNLSSRSWMLWRDDEEDADDDQGADGGGGGGTSHGPGVTKKKSLAYTPSFGTHCFWYRGRLLLFKRKQNNEGASFMTVSEREEISLCCFGRNPWILKELLLEARTQYLERDSQQTIIYRGTLKPGTLEPTWQRCLARATRPFSTVILNETVKQDLIDDVTDYLTPATQRWYTNRGIPYRRGYLLHGPPGTGKSSLSLALAGFFKMRIYMVSLSSMTASEENLSTLFAELPRRCVVLLEDIDSAGLTHTREAENEPVGGEEKKAEEAKTKKKAGRRKAKVSGSGSGSDSEPGSGSDSESNPDEGNDGTAPRQAAKSLGRRSKEALPAGRLSLSGLLNILDGVASQEGRVLIMTTNHLEKLDKALIRPGRVDMTVHFGLADSDMTAAIFRAIFAYLEGDDEPASLRMPALRGSKPGSTPEKQAEAEKRAEAEERARQQARAAQTARVNVLAREFATRIPPLEFSPAELQGFLMKHKRDAASAVANAEDFVDQTRRERRAKEVREAEERREQAKKDEKRREDKEKAKAEIESKTEAEAEEGKSAVEAKGDKNALNSLPVTVTRAETIAKDRLEVQTMNGSSEVRYEHGYATPVSGEA